MSEAKAHILLVEDDRNLGFVVEDNLCLQGYAVTRCEDGEAGWEAFAEGGYDLCILDVMLPKQDGFTLAQQIRERDTQVPILFLTAKGMKEDRLKGFALGGDDYIVKPFSIEELVARMEVFLRRSRQVTAPTVLTLGTYTFTPGSLTLSHAKETRRLTAREAELLTCLAQQANAVIKREAILMTVWGDDDYFLGRSLDVFISRLRKYLRHDEGLQLQNVHGVGFQLVVP